jgi:hypothetical protein
VRIELENGGKRMDDREVSKTRLVKLIRMVK